jgi:hypothetical protein
VNKWIIVAVVAGALIFLYLNQESASGCDQIEAINAEIHEIESARFRRHTDFLADAKEFSRQPKVWEEMKKSWRESEAIHRKLEDGVMADLRKNRARAIEVLREKRGQSAGATLTALCPEIN